VLTVFRKTWIYTVEKILGEPPR